MPIRVDEDWAQFSFFCNCLDIKSGECRHTKRTVNRCLEKKYCPRVAKPKKPASTPWRKSLDAYKEAAERGLNETILDAKWILKMREENPGVDVTGTCHKSHTDFWSTEAGWLNKKKRKGSTIDWKKTYQYAVSNPRLQVKAKGRYEI